jgi:hypothetical protein
MVTRFPSALKFGMALAALPLMEVECFAALAPRVPGTESSVPGHSTEVLSLVQDILEEFYTDGIDQIVSAQLNEAGDIEGEFIDQVGARQVKRYKYLIQDDNVAFKLLNPNEVEQFSVFAPLFGPGSRAGRKKNCRKGTPCGDTCIGAQKTCKKKPGSAVKVKIAEVKKGLASVDLPPAILAWEDRHRLDSIESSGVFDASGKLIFEKSGTEDEITYSPDELVKMKGQTLTHNHPLPKEWGNVSNVGLGFSTQDIELAFWYELAEMRVVSGGFRFSLKPPDKGWNADLLRKNGPAYQKIYDDQLAKSRVKRDRALAQGKSEIEARKILNHDFHHAVAVRFAKKLGLQYTREKI